MVFSAVLRLRGLASTLPSLVIVAWLPRCLPRFIVALKIDMTGPQLKLRSDLGETSPL